MSCEVFPSLGQIAQKHHKKDSEQVDPKIMTTAMVIDDLDDHNEECDDEWTGTGRD